MSRLPKPNCLGGRPLERFISLLHPEPDDIDWIIDLPCFIWDKFLAVDIELEPPIDWGGSVPSSNSHRIEKVPDARLTSILDLPWNRRIHIQLWTFKELRSSGTTFDVYIRPPMNSKNSYPTLNLQKIEKFRNHILRRNWTSYGIEGFISDFESSWIGEVPDQLRTFV